MKSKAIVSADVTIQIPFHDIDLVEVAWHGHYAKYFEIARSKLFDMIDYNYEQMKGSGYVWPVIDMRIRYVKPARYQQNVLVVAGLTEWENRLRVEYLITDVATGERLTKGYTVQVAVDISSGEMLLASPRVLYTKIGVDEPQ